MDVDVKKGIAQANFGCKGMTVSSSVHGHGLTLVYAHVLPEVIVTAKVLPASFDRTLVRCDGIMQSQPEATTKKRNKLTLLVGVDRSHMPLQMFAASEALVASVDHTLVHPHVFLHTTLHHEHRCRGNTAAAGLLCEVRHGHGRS